MYLYHQMKAVIKSLALLSAFMLLMHSVVPHVHHRHLSAAEVSVESAAGTDILTIISQALHNSHAPKDLEELSPSNGEIPTIPPATLALLADWAAILATPYYQLPATPVYYPEAALPVIDHFTGSLIISRPPPVC